MEVRRSSFIVVGSSIKVPTKFASHVTILSSFPSISLLLLLGSSSSRRGRESFGIYYGGKPVRFYSLVFPSFLHLHLSIFIELLFFCLTSTSPSSPVFILPLAHPEPFFPSSIRFGDNNRRTNGANLQSRLANGRSRGARYLCQTGQKKKRSFHICP